MRTQSFFKGVGDAIKLNYGNRSSVECVIYGGKISFTFVVLTFMVLIVRLLVEKSIQGGFASWFSNDAMKLLNFLAIVVTIIVVAIHGGLPLAVTLNLAFAMKKLMNDRALVRHLSASENIVLASCICTNKTRTLTTTHMVVTKIWISEKVVYHIHEIGVHDQSLVDLSSSGSVKWQ